MLEINNTHKEIWKFFDTLSSKTKFIITCPAVILAANRKLSVIGRIKILINSTMVKNGANHIGALSGRKWAINCLAEKQNLLAINNIHNGSLIEIVNKICLVILGAYGTMPIIFIKIIIIKVHNIIEILIFICFNLEEIIWI